MNAKTPVMLLQEYLVQEGVLPRYSFIPSGFIELEPIFQWEVSAKGVKAVGKGKTKKEAKHNAAQNLLLQLKGEKIWLDEVPIIAPHTKIVVGNSVGALQEFCAQRCMVLPHYEVSAEWGPPHAKMFRLKCSVLNKFVEAEASTKKQAKQLVAQKMMSILNDNLVKEEIITPVIAAYQEREITSKACEATKEAFEKNIQFRVNYNPQGIDNHLCSFSEYFLKNILPRSETLQVLSDWDDKFLDIHPDLQDLLDKVADQLKYKLQYNFLKSKSAVHFLCNLQIIELNNINFIGVGTSKDEARKDAIVKALKFFVTMSKEL